MLTLKSKYLELFNSDSTDVSKLNIVLDDIAGMYNSNNRCKSIGEGCFYSPNSVDNSTTGCAVGMMFELESQDELDNMGCESGNTDIISLTNEYGSDFHPFILKYIWIFRGFQALHDSDLNWDQEGLSENGHNYIKKLRSYILNETTPKIQ